MLTETKRQSIQQNIKKIKEEIEAAKTRGGKGQNVELLLATKTRSPEEINCAIAAGVTLIGENRAQELCEKYAFLDREKVKIHFIGALQRNKVKSVIDKVDMIQSVDRFSLGEEIHRQAEKLGKVMDVLCEVNIGEENSKSGVRPEEALELVKKLSKLGFICVRGLMTVPPDCAEIDKQKQYFQKMFDLYIDISAKKIDNVSMAILSLGMSGDYSIAVECGSNLVRIGSAVFGQRQ